MEELTIGGAKRVSIFSINIFSRAFRNNNFLYKVCLIHQPHLLNDRWQVSIPKGKFRNQARENRMKKFLLKS